ncbi:MAG: glycosyltransferase family 4 protein [Planctomycetaceae bacterium]
MSQDGSSLATHLKIHSDSDQQPVAVRSNDDANLIVTDIHPRITGVGSTIRTLAPHIHSLEPMMMVSPRTVSGIPRTGIIGAIAACLKKPVDRPFRIWHARRNKEMLLGLLIKHLFRGRIRLVMTSCALRRHSWFPRQLLGSMDAIIATSDEAASYVRNVVATIPHGVDCDRFQPAEDRLAAFRQLNFPGQRGISIAGRIRPEKGTDLFVDAMIALLPQFPDFTACIAGRATVEHEAFLRHLKSRIEKAGLTDRFVWAGEVPYDQMAGFHSAMSLCVAPARYEGFGLVPLEAMACGVPVVASRTGCYSDVIVPQVTGELVPCDDLPALIQALNSLMANPDRLDQMGQVGRIQVEQNYSAKLEAARINEVYRQLWENAA